VLSKLGDLLAQDSLSKAMPLMEEAYKLDPEDTFTQARYAASLYDFSSYGPRRTEAKKLLEDAADWGEWYAHQVLNHLKNVNKPSNKVGGVISVLAWLGKWFVRVVITLVILVAGFMFWVTYLWRPNLP
jgi:hypothetical protein